MLYMSTTFVDMRERECYRFKKHKANFNANLIPNLICDYCEVIIQFSDVLLSMKYDFSLKKMSGELFVSTKYNGVYLKEKLVEDIISYDCFINEVCKKAEHYSADINRICLTQDDELYIYKSTGKSNVPISECRIVLNLVTTR